MTWQKLEGKLITEKTRIAITLANFIILVIFVVTSVSAATAWKTQIDNDVSSNTKAIYENECSINDVKTTQSQIQTSLAEIKTDLKWIRASMERDK